MRFHCSDDASCPALLIAGDPHAPDPFRGYGDPSLEHDPGSDTLWLSYSWLDLQAGEPAAGPDRRIRTHLAKSSDRGQSFQFVRAVNQTTPATDPGSSDEGWLQHEVSTLLREAADRWQVLWLTYFDRYGEAGNADHRDFHYRRSLTVTPEELGDGAVVWARGIAAQAYGAVNDLTAISELADCAAPTEPALFRHGGETYLLTNCVVIDDNGARDPGAEYTALLRETTSGYAFVATVLDGADAQDLGVERIEQIDLSVSRDGTTLLIATPISGDPAEPEHGGCVVFEFTDFANGALLRDASGRAVPRVVVTGDTSFVGPGSGPGLCTYDAASETGLLMVLKRFQVPFDLEFSLRATGIHP